MSTTTISNEAEEAFSAVCYLINPELPDTRAANDNVRCAIQTACETYAARVNKEQAEKIEVLQRAIQQSGVFAYISKHAHECRRENQSAGYEVFTEATFSAIAADHKRLEDALAATAPRKEPS